MIDLITIGIIVAATVKVTEYRAEKRAKKAGETTTHGESKPAAPVDPLAALPPRHFSPSARAMFLETLGEYCQGPDGKPVIKHAFRSHMAKTLITARLSKCAFAKVTGIAPPGKVLTYRLVPLPAGDKRSAMDAVREVWDRDGDVYLSLSCILDKGDRIVAFAPDMPDDIAWSDHFARLSQQYDVDRPALVTPVNPESLNGGSHPNPPPDPASSPAQEK